MSRAHERLSLLAAVGFSVALGFLGGMEILSPVRGGGDPHAELDRFGEAYLAVQTAYVRETTEAELIDAALRGMVSSLDSHSSYIDAATFMALNPSQPLGAIGLELTIAAGEVRVVSAIDNTPAARAGLAPGDVIVAIDNERLAGLPLEKVVGRLRGELGSTVTLAVRQNNARKPVEIALRRAIVLIVNVTWRREGGIGYVRLRTFNEGTADAVERAVHGLANGADPIRGYVIDLRDNPGGLLNQVVEVADKFLEDGDVAKLRGRRDNKSFRASSGDIAKGKPIIVLVNESSAAGSEIFAAAMQERHRATVIGMRTYGIGSIQTIIPVGRGAMGGAFRLTTSLVYMPAGRTIQVAGVMPDILVSQLSENDTSRAATPVNEAMLAYHLPGDERPAITAPVIRPTPGVMHADFQLAYAIDWMKGHGAAQPGRD